MTEELRGVQFREDPNVVRFSAHCGAPEGGTEGLLIADEPISSIALHSAVVLSSTADTSAESAWPQDAGPAAVWNCEPQALPRYWRLNKHIDFKVVSSDGSHLDRSFTPDLLPSRDDGSDNPSNYRYPCGEGQLTAIGFRQAVGLGKHLSDAYGELAAQAVDAEQLEIRSIDTKAALATTVGILMALLAAPRALAALGEGVVLPIKAGHSQHLPSLADEASSGLEKARGGHLLSRWCHQLPMPCESTRFGSRRCISIEEAGAIVRQDEIDLCPLPSETHPTNGTSRLPVDAAIALFGEVRRLLQRPHQSLTLLTISSQIATALMQILTGDDICSDPLLARPPVGSRLAVERWRKTDSFFLRVLWNGEDVTRRLPVCDYDATAPGVQPGCDEQAIADFYKT